MIRPGEVYMADFAEAGPHPVIVLSREELKTPWGQRKRRSKPAGSSG